MHKDVQLRRLRSQRIFNESHPPSFWRFIIFCFKSSFWGNERRKKANISHLRALKTLYFYLCKGIKNKKNKLKGFLQRILQEIMKKDNTWNIRRLVNETIVPSTQRPSILYWRLSDFCFYACQNLEGGNCSRVPPRSDGPDLGQHLPRLLGHQFLCWRLLLP